MDEVDTLHVGRYWSEVLCCTIMTNPGRFARGSFCPRVVSPGRFALSRFALVLWVGRFALIRWVVSPVSCFAGELFRPLLLLLLLLLL